MKDLNYYKNNAEEDYKNVPISILRYINELEKQQEIMYSEEDLKNAFLSGCKSERQLKPRVKCWQEWFEQFKKK